MVVFVQFIDVVVPTLYKNDLLFVFDLETELILPFLIQIFILTDGGDVLLIKMLQDEIGVETINYIPYFAVGRFE
jgi:hypothetical protein